MKLLKKIKELFIKPKPKPPPTYLDLLQLKIKVIENTIKFPMFMNWLISDILYGFGRNQLNGSNQLNPVDVITAYKEWERTGRKPTNDVWDRIKSTAHSVEVWNLADCAVDIDNAYLAIDQMNHSLADINKIHIRMIQDAHLIKLDMLINDDSELYSWEDYEKV